MTTNAYPKTLVVIRDCHASHNIVLTARTADDEQLYRKMAEKKGWKVAERKAKAKAEAEAEPTCDNCATMEFRNSRDGAAHRYCSLYGQWIPDNEQSPVCDHHSALNGAFLLHLTPLAKEGGEL